MDGRPWIDRLKGDHKWHGNKCSRMPFAECEPVLRIDFNFLSANVRKKPIISDINEHVNYHPGRVAKWMRIRARRVTATPRLRYSRGEVKMR